MKFDNTDLKNTNFIKKSSISINNIDIYKIVVSSKILNISLVTKILKKLDLYAYFIYE